MNFKSMIVSILLVGICIISIISFIISFEQENAVNDTIMKYSSINTTYVTVSSELSKSSSDANTTMEGFVGEGKNPIIAGVELVFSSILSAGTVFMKSTITFFNIMTGPASEILHISPMIIGTILAIVIITLMLLAWRLYKVGE